MPHIEDVNRWQGQQAHAANGDKLGTIADVYLDEDTGRPEWITIRTGLFGTKVSFAPLAEATASDDGVWLPYDKEQVKNAPDAEADGNLSQHDEAALYRHYGLNYSEAPSDSGLPTGHQTQDRQPVGHDTSGPTTDDAMTRSEEEVRIGKSRHETGRALLRKYVATERVQTTVPVQREEMRVEREPITDDNIDQATAGPAISDEEHEVVLYEDQPVVDKRVLPRERVRLDTETVTDERQISERIRKEHIDIDDDGVR
jgi:uncharacterized protein (TIGR02271 family)